MSLEIYIRPLRLADADVSWRWRNDPEVWRYTGTRPDRYITREIEQEWLAKVLSDDSCKRFAVCVADNDQYIGNVQLTGISQETKTAEFHIFIGDRAFWNRGVGKAATALLLDYAKNILKLKQVTLSVNPNNTTAIRIYANQGFQPVDDVINMVKIL